MAPQHLQITRDLHMVRRRYCVQKYCEIFMCASFKERHTFRFKKEHLCGEHVNQLKNHLNQKTLTSKTQQLNKTVERTVALQREFCGKCIQRQRTTSASVLSHTICYLVFCVGDTETLSILSPN